MTPSSDLEVRLPGNQALACTVVQVVALPGALPLSGHESSRRRTKSLNLFRFPWAVMIIHRCGAEHKVRRSSGLVND